MYSEKQHFSALLISHPKLPNLESMVSNYLGTDFEVKNSNNGNYLHLAYLSKTPFHKELVEGGLYPNQKRPQTRKIEGKTRYVYDCYLSEFHYAD